MDIATLALIAAGAFALSKAGKSEETTPPTSGGHIFSSSLPTFYDASQPIPKDRVVIQNKSTGQSLVYPDGFSFTPNPLQTSGKGLMERIQNKDIGVSTKPMTAKQAMSGLDDAALQRMTVVLEDIQQLRFFGDMLSGAWIMMSSNPKTGTAEQKAIYEVGKELFDWFAYHRWVVGKGLFDAIVAKLKTKSCSLDSKLPKHSHHTTFRFNGCDKTEVWTPEDRDYYPALIKNPYQQFRDHIKKTQLLNEKCLPTYPLACPEQDFMEQKTPWRLTWEAGASLGSDFLGWAQVTSDLASVQNSYGYAEKGHYFGRIGPCGALIEWAAARYISTGFPVMVNPDIGMLAGKLLLDSMSQALGLLVSAGVMIATSGGNIASIISGAMTAFAGLMKAVFAITTTVADTRNNRKKLGFQLDKVWLLGEQEFGLTGAYWGAKAQQASAFSGYRADILIPKIWVYQDVQDPYFHHFGLVSDKPSGWAGSIAAIPQLPMYYLYIDYPFCISRNPLDRDILVIQLTDDFVDFTETLKNPDQIKEILKQSFSKVGLGA